MITLECNYSKKIGLPAYSSHQFSVTLRTEISDASRVEKESHHLYDLLQTAVDTALQQVGYLPGANANGNGVASSRGDGHTNGHGNGTSSDVWKCSDKQKGLILDIIEENKLPKMQVEDLARQRFNTPVKMLDKLQASGLITELLEMYPSQQQSGSRATARGGRR